MNVSSKPVDHFVMNGDPDDVIAWLIADLKQTLQGDISQSGFEGVEIALMMAYRLGQRSAANAEK